LASGLCLLPTTLNTTIPSKANQTGAMQSFHPRKEIDPISKTLHCVQNTKWRKRWRPYNS
jgi:hypothetical protein